MGGGGRGANSGGGGGGGGDSSTGAAAVVVDDPDNVSHWAEVFNSMLADAPCEGAAGPMVEPCLQSRAQLCAALRDRLRRLAPFSPLARAMLQRALAGACASELSVPSDGPEFLHTQALGSAGSELLSRFPRARVCGEDDEGASPAPPPPPPPAVPRVEEHGELVAQFLRHLDAWRGGDALKTALVYAVQRGCTFARLLTVARDALSRRALKDMLGPAGRALEARFLEWPLVLGGADAVAVAAVRGRPGVRRAPPPPAAPFVLPSQRRDRRRLYTVAVALDCLVASGTPDEAVMALRDAGDAIAAVMASGIAPGRRGVAIGCLRAELTSAAAAAAERVGRDEWWDCGAAVMLGAMLRSLT